MKHPPLRRRVVVTNPPADRRDSVASRGQASRPKFGRFTNDENGMGGVGREAYGVRELAPAFVRPGAIRKRRQAGALQTLRASAQSVFHSESAKQSSVALVS